MSAPSVDAFVTDSRLRLAVATRHLIDAVLTSEGATDAELDGVTDAIEALGDRLHGDAAGGLRPVGRRSRFERDHTSYLPRSPLVGEVSPIAPPFEWSFANDRMVGTGVFGAAYEGPPGYVHGGWVALAFDEILGMVNIAGKTPGMTAKLSVRYRAPTPLHTPVRLETWTERIEGRRIIAHGTLHAAGQLCAEGEGLFISISPELAAKYFGTRSDP